MLAIPRLLMGTVSRLSAAAVCRMDRMPWHLEKTAMMRRAMLYELVRAELNAVRNHHTARSGRSRPRGLASSASLGEPAPPGLLITQFWPMAVIAAVTLGAAAVLFRWRVN